MLIYYLKTPEGKFVNFDWDSGGYPYFSGLPWITMNASQASDRLTEYLRMKLIPEGTNVFQVEM